MLRFSNKNKLIVSFIAILLLGLLASTTVAYLHVKDRLEIAFQQEIQLQADIISQRLNHWSNGAIVQVEHFALYLADVDIQHNRKHNLASFVNMHPDAHQLYYLGYVIDKEGYFSFDNWQAPKGYDPRSRSWYIEGKQAKAPKLGKPYISVSANQSAYLAVTSPIIQQGQFIGLASAHVKFDDVLALLSDIDSSLISKVFLVDQLGNLDLPAKQNIKMEWQQALKKIIAQRNTAKLTSIDNNAEVLFYISKSIDNMASRIVFAVQKEAIAQKIYHDTFKLLIKFLLIFIVVTIALYLSNRHILAPLFNYLELDSVTRLPSKNHFKQQLSEEFLPSSQAGRLLIISMENYSRITATYTSKHVSMLQNQIKERIQQQLTVTALLGHFSESRYIAYIQQDSSNIEPLKALTSALAAPYMIAGSEIYCTFRVGVSNFPEHGQDVETLIDNAFSALATVNRQESNTFTIFTEQINQQFSEAEQINNAMTKALTTDEFFMVYQPQVDTISGKLIAVEALVRWQSEVLGRVVSPVEFIAIAESNGLMVSLGEKIIDLVFAQVQQWQKQGVDLNKVCLNISPQQLLAANFSELLLSKAEHYAISPAHIELEITETSLLTDPKECISILHKLNDLGFTIAIDDFGTGYSSLEYLNTMPLHKLKIDRSFIVDIDKNIKSAALVKTIIAMANNLNLQVLAEGVENMEEVQALQALSCQFVQGYFYAKPLTATDLVIYIDNKSNINR
ncbi:EAL domain, c-di-GMP-specific phosphodiesterase class I (or its enzymatically inactive variant) [Colwellia chukchiensis]|uniref:EAL domain, c-di-GMP-specific phosphodiesterase class I (Or its enzymatically inactive variant) n=1 Tax=Colwellia chukchiensis TaxID=641665 RepID=A0A1H7R480_9GAMM|nr:EAL domain-containing protein [Colwellia chukchiensis]SEL55060.1 EAL domain, c-di-GMP-specific phosphodiesterase class I (or its enzymatically inactive variant) [Colwellia chukchiensis]